MCGTVSVDNWPRCRHGPRRTTIVSSWFQWWESKRRMFGEHVTVHTLFQCGIWSATFWNGVHSWRCGCGRGDLWDLRALLWVLCAALWTRQSPVDSLLVPQRQAPGNQGRRRARQASMTTQIKLNQTHHMKSDTEQRSWGRGGGGGGGGGKGMRGRRRKPSYGSRADKGSC